MIKVQLLEHMGSDRVIAEAAWTSSLDFQKKKSRTDEDVARVVAMLASAKHSVPFESVVFRFWFRLPIATDRQLMTHRMASHSGLSGRYRTVPTDWLEMSQDVLDVYEKIHPGDSSLITAAYDRLCKQANEFYIYECASLKALAKDGVITNDEYKRVREFLRGVLPQHNMTERVTTMNLRSFANFIKLRLKPDAQPEIGLLAELMLKEVKKANVCPIAIDWLEKNNWNL